MMDELKRVLKFSSLALAWRRPLQELCAFVRAPAGSLFVAANFLPAHPGFSSATPTIMDARPA